MCLLTQYPVLKEIKYYFYLPYQFVSLWFKEFESVFQLNNFIQYVNHNHNDLCNINKKNIFVSSLSIKKIVYFDIFQYKLLFLIRE